MVMLACGTFDYVGTLEPGEGGGFACQLQLREPIVRTGDLRHDERLLGPSPRLTVARGRGGQVVEAQAGTTPAAVDVLHWTLTRGTRGWWRLGVPRARRVTRVTFDTHVALLDVMCSGDSLHLRRDCVAALGLSVLRGGQLVFAIGDVTQVALGDGLHANWLTPPRLAALPILSPEPFASAPHPLCVTTGVDVWRLGAGESVLAGGVRATVLRSFDPGGDPVRATGCALIWREPLVPEAIVRASATLFDTTFTLAGT